MKSNDLLRSVQKMYDEAGGYFSKTRLKKYGQLHSQNWPVTQKYLDRLQQGQSVLDVGCGNGRLVSGLPVGVSYIGVDFSETLLAEARKKYSEREFRFGNLVESSSWKGLSRYDAVFCVAVLHHIPERDEQIFILKQMKKATKKGGFLYLTVWNLWQERFLQHHLNSLELKKTNPRWVEVPFDTKWKRFCVQMDIPYLVEIMHEAGWDLEELFYADSAGNQTDIMHGQNLIAVAKNI